MPGEPYGVVTFLLILITFILVLLLALGALPN
jgi:hypothetical protein